MVTHRVCFVCLGNICRSPLAEGLFKAHLASADRGDAVEVDSCGTGGWHVGDPPDRRSVATARRRGVDISGQRSRQLAPEDYDRFDLLVAMDRSNLETLRRRAPDASRAACVLFMDLVPGGAGEDVPDPYYGEGDGFERVAQMLEGGMAPLRTRLIDDGADR